MPFHDRSASFCGDVLQRESLEPGEDFSNLAHASRPAATPSGRGPDNMETTGALLVLGVEPYQGAGSDFAGATCAFRVRETELLPLRAFLHGNPPIRTSRTDFGVIDPVS